MHRQMTGRLIMSGGLLLILSACERKAAPIVPTVAIFNLLSHPILDQSVAGIKAGLARSGFADSLVHIVDVNANGEMDKIPAFARSLLASAPDVIVPVSTPVTQAVAKAASANQQIVFSTVTNPADVGMAGSPPNMTGVSDAVNYEANIALILELFPATKTIGMVYNPGEANSVYGIQQVQQIATGRGLTLRLATVSKSDEVAQATRTLAPKVDCFYVGSDNTVVSALAGLVKVALETRRPVIASDQGSVAEGALAAVSVDYTALGERVGEIVAEILRNKKKAGSIPHVRFLGNKLILNAKAATSMHFVFPDSTRARAAQVLQ